MSLLLTLLAAVLFAVGWVAGVVWVVLVWCWSALAVGFDEAQKLRGRRDRDRVEAPV